MKLNRTGSRWDRTQRININDNWDEIERKYFPLLNLGKEAESTLKKALEINAEAQKTNDMNESVQQQIDTLIAESGTSDAELLQARVDSKGIEYPILKERLDKDEVELQNQKDFKDYEIQNKTRKTEALFTIWDDDSTAEMWDLLRPIQQEFNIPMTTAILTSWVDGNLGVTKSQLLQMIDEGWEPSFHGQGQSRLDQMSYQEQVDYYSETVDILNSWGIENVNTLTYPFGRRNDDVVLAGREFFRAGRTTDYGINRPPFQTWDLTCINGTTGRPDELTMESIKKDIVDISENGGWGIWVTHANLMNDLDITQLREVIEYIISKGNIEFVTANEALNRMGNIIDSGRYWKSDKSKPHFVVGADGSQSSHTSPDMFIQRPYRVVNGNNTPSSFKSGSIEYTTVSGVDGFPMTGALTTNTTQEGAAFQSLITTENRIYTRQQKWLTDEWGAWFENNTVVTVVDRSEINADSKPDDFPDNKISYTRISDVSGFPAGTGTRGLLITNRVGFDTFQEFRSNDGTSTRYSLYQRRWMGTSWEEWEALPYDFSSTNGHYRNYFSFEDRKPGEKFFNTTLNKPMFINADSDGFVDGMGNPITL